MLSRIADSLVRFGRIYSAFSLPVCCFCSLVALICSPRYGTGSGVTCQSCVCMYVYVYLHVARSSLDNCRYRSLAVQEHFAEAICVTNRCGTIENDYVDSTINDGWFYNAESSLSRYFFRRKRKLYKDS